MRRVMLLVLGICGSLGAAVLLCCNAAAQPYLATATPNLQFPFVIPGTPLVVMNPVCYDGPLSLEGIDGEGIGVSALVIRNTQNEMVRWADFTLMSSRGTQKFQITMLPPGKTLLVVERDQQLYHVSDYTGSWVDGLIIGGSSCGASAWITQDDKIAVVNTSDSLIGELTIHYKTLDPQSGMYLGGQTYQKSVINLQPGERRILDGGHVVYGYSDIVAVEGIK